MVGRGGAVPERLGGSGGGREVRAPGRYFVNDVESNWLRGSVSHTRVRSPPGARRKNSSNMPTIDDHVHDAPSADARWGASLPSVWIMVNAARSRAKPRDGVKREKPA